MSEVKKTGEEGSEKRKKNKKKRKERRHTGERAKLTASLTGCIDAKSFLG